MTQRPITLEDLWRLKRPAAVALSPDYTHACASITGFDMEENQGTSSLWLLGMQGDDARPLTTCGEKDGQPAWRPDGQEIAFVGKRGSGKDADLEPQIYLISPSGGEARRLTRIATGASGIKWFPDGKRIAFVSWVWPDLKDDKAQAARLKANKESKVKALVVEKDQYRYWDHWLADGRVPHLFVADVRSGKCRDLFAGTGYELRVADTDATCYDISPDGKEVAFGFDPAADKRLDHDQVLIALDVASGKARMLTEGSGRDCHSPRYSPDGRWLAYVSRDQAKSPIDQEKLTLLDRELGTSAVISAGWDRAVNAPLAWAGDSQSVWFTAEDSGRQHLWRWPLAAKKPEVVVQGGVVAEFSLAGGAIAFIRHSISSPPAVFAADLQGEHERPLESLNRGVLRGVRLGATEECHFKGARGESVQMWLVFPPNFDPRKKWPLLHSIHGGPHTSFGDLWHYRWNSQLFAAQGYVVALVNYHGSSSFGQRFMESINGQWGKLEYADIEAATDLLLQRRYIDGNRLYASGGSYGGKMVAYMNGRTDRYKAYVCHAGCFDWVGMFADDAYFWHPRELGAFYWDDPKKIAAQNPLTQVKAARTPTLVMHGELDYRVPVTQGFAYYNTLRAKGVPARLVYFPDENHWILKPQNARLWYREFFAWLARF
jgi:dipeptidyl aminopeptidase/acylaminoacyl peptidase